MSTPIRVLILEDAQADAQLMVYELRQADFAPVWQRVETQTDYLAALDPALDLILADYALPQFDGLHALELLHARGLDIPFIIVSGVISEEVAVESMKRGAADYLLKDRLARLGAAVTQALEQRHLRREKRLVEARYQLLFERNLAGLFRMQRDGQVLECNDACARILGYASREAILTQHAGLPYAEPGEQERLLARLRPGQGLSNLELRLQRQDGQPIWVLMNVLEIAEGETTLFEGQILDITERKQAEREREHLISQLQEALATVRYLQGMIPICSYCRRVRNDRDAWLPLESYVAQQLDAQFSHGMCPDCQKSVARPELERWRRRRQAQDETP